MWLLFYCIALYIRSSRRVSHPSNALNPRLWSFLWICIAATRSSSDSFGYTCFNHCVFKSLESNTLVVLSFLQFLKQFSLQLFKFLRLLLVLGYLVLHLWSLANKTGTCDRNFLFYELVLLLLPKCFFLSDFLFLLVNVGKLQLSVLVQLLPMLLFSETNFIHGL